MHSRAWAPLLAVAAIHGLGVTTAVAACPAAPRALCRLGGKNSLRILNASPDDADRLAWKWGKGTADGPSDFGTPTTSTSLSLCVYDPSGLIATFDLPAGGTCGGAPCWSATSLDFHGEGWT